jgi:hypothetical protein
MSGFRRAPLPSLLDLAVRTAFRVGFPLARIWWRLAHARHEGVAVAVYVGPLSCWYVARIELGGTCPVVVSGAARRQTRQDAGAGAVPPEDVIEMRYWIKSDAWYPLRRSAQGKRSYAR